MSAPSRANGAESGKGRAEHELRITDLHVTAGGREVIRGIDLQIRSGEVHAVMGPNGSGKSTLAHALMGRPGVTVTAGSVQIDEVEILGQPTWKRARAGLFLAHQQPIEVPGVELVGLLGEALADAGDREPQEPEIEREARAIGFDPRLVHRALNVDLSGGERKRSEMLQLSVLRPRFAILDEVDSGLDVDALDAVARQIERATEEWGLGVLAVTHFSRLLNELRADVVHVLVGGTIVASGGPELAGELEISGYVPYLAAPPKST